MLVQEPVADSVESVLFLIGDAGKALWANSPLLTHLRGEVNQWSSTMRDSTVIVLWLGDNVYPGGVRSGTPDFIADSVHLQGQLDVILSDTAKKHRARGIFIAGNHDWGHRTGAVGERRLKNMEELIQRRGPGSVLLPKAGDPGPSIIDLGEDLRVLLIDTAWWLLSPDRESKRKFVLELDTALASSKGRQIIVAAHHPWASGSAHGGLVPFWKTLGIKWLLNKAGASLQDLNSLPYRELKNELNALFKKHGVPLLFAGGHDHVLQVHRAMNDTDPHFSIVSGSASKLTKVGDSPGIIFRRSEPGFMRLVVHKNGAVDLFVVSAPTHFQECVGTPAAVEQCMKVGPLEYKSINSLRIKEPRTR